MSTRCTQKPWPQSRIPPSTLWCTHTARSNRIFIKGKLCMHHHPTDTCMTVMTAVINNNCTTPRAKTPIWTVTRTAQGSPAEPPRAAVRSAPGVGRDSEKQSTCLFSLCTSSVSGPGKSLKLESSHHQWSPTPRAKPHTLGLPEGSPAQQPRAAVRHSRSFESVCEKRSEPRKSSCLFSKCTSSASGASARTWTVPIALSMHTTVFYQVSTRH